MKKLFLLLPLFLFSCTKQEVSEDIFALEERIESQSFTAGDIENARRTLYEFIGKNNYGYKRTKETNIFFKNINDITYSYILSNGLKGYPEGIKFIDIGSDGINLGDKFEVISKDYTMVSYEIDDTEETNQLISYYEHMLVLDYYLFLKNKEKEIIIAVGI